MKTYAFGYDFGNAETGAVCYLGGQVLARTLPSVSIPASLRDLADKRSAKGETFRTPAEALKHGEYVLDYQGETFVGQLALDQFRDASTGRGDISRYWSPRSIELLLTISGSMIDESEYALIVVTGLPVATYAAEKRELVTKALKGEHHFTLNGRARTCHVTSVKVIMEGAGAIIAYGSNQKVPQGAIDIGGRTTDLFASLGQSPTIDLCKGQPFGVEQAGDLLNASFQTRYGFPLANRMVREALRAYAGTESWPVVLANGQEVPTHELRQWTKDAVERVGRDITSFVSATWNNSEKGVVAGDMRVVIVGGGTHYFADILKQRIPHAVTVPQPELANARGYAALAEQLRVAAVPALRIA